MTSFLENWLGGLIALGFAIGWSLGLQLLGPDHVYHGESTMKGSLAAALCLAFGVWLLPIPLPAHHGTAVYDTSKSLEMQGTVVAFNWVNPHASIEWEVKTEKGAPKHWIVELTSPGMLTRSGWHHDSLKPGDEVTIYFHPAKSGSRSGIFQRVVFADGRPDLIDPRVQ
jgi:Family of unknown function (DUF6152)